MGPHDQPIPPVAVMSPLPLPPELPPVWIRAAWLADVDAIKRLIDAEAGPGCAAEQTLRLAHLCLLAGSLERGDDLLLAIDERLPQLALVPDRWGLWPLGAGQESSLSASDRQAQGLAADYHCWRHASLENALETWFEHVWKPLLPEPKAQWQQLLEPGALALLALLLGRPGAGERLRAQLEPLLVQTMGEAVVESSPEEALLFWSGVCHRCPSWDYARLKAADLSLQMERYSPCRTYLQGASPEQRRNPWLHDIEARLAMADGRKAEALSSWDEAMHCASGDEDLVELLRQRRQGAEWGSDPELAPMAGATEATDPDLERLAARIDEITGRLKLELPAPRGQARDLEAFERFLDAASARLALAA